METAGGPPREASRLKDSTDRQPPETGDPGRFTTWSWCPLLFGASLLSLWFIPGDTWAGWFSHPMRTAPGSPVPGGDPAGHSAAAHHAARCRLVLDHGGDHRGAGDAGQDTEPQDGRFIPDPLPMGHHHRPAGRGIRDSSSPARPGSLVRRDRRILVLRAARSRSDPRKHVHASQPCAAVTWFLGFGQYQRRFTGRVDAALACTPCRPASPHGRSTSSDDAHSVRPVRSSRSR